MNEGLFRKVALARLSSPEKLDEMIRVIRPRAWLALGAIGALAAATLLWGLTANLPVRAQAQGALVAPNSVFEVNAPASGVVADTIVKEGANVSKGQVLARITAPDARGPVRVLSPTSGTLVEVGVLEGELVQAGNLMYRVVAERPRDLRLHTYVSPVTAASLRPGMDVRITPITAASESFGFLKGRIDSIGAFPASPQAVHAAVQDRATAQELIAAAGSIPIAVHVELERARTPSGYAWSRGVGPPIEIHDGTLASLEITTRDRRPIDFILGNQ